jgi:lipoprotein-releasing system permease protein
VHVPGMLSFQFGGQWSTRQIMFIGIDERTHSAVSDFGKYLQHPANREHLSFDLRPDGYDTSDHQMGPDAPPRPDMKPAGWQWRQFRQDQQRQWEEAMRSRGESPAIPANPFDLADQGKATVPPEQLGTHGSKQSNAESSNVVGPVDPFQRGRGQETAKQADPSHEQSTGVILGIALACVREKDGADRFLLLPGDDIKVTFPNAGVPPKAISGTFTVVDFYESKMSEYDGNFVFVPIRKLQELRGMIDPQTGVGNVSSIQIKLKPGADADAVRDKLRAAMPGYLISTWQDKQGPLLAAVQMESAVLNILLFMIIAVAGFGILATFFMIVVEKTRDIGILKSLGASARGVMGIFLGYGLSLGIVGSGVGCAIGLLFVRYINNVRSVLEAITGQKVFDPSIYYFYKIPTIVDPFTVAWIVVGALLIAVLASVLPALRAALLHPVEALRYE